MILISVITVSSFCIYDISTNGLGTGLVAFDKNTFLDLIGFAVYTYEGIGVVMPIMATCEVPEQFSKILVLAIGTLAILYVAFSELCYLTFGENLTETIILLQLPSTNGFVIAVKLLYILALLCSYPLVMFPCVTIMEKYTLPKKYFPTKTQKRDLMRKFQRVVIVVFSVYVALVLADKLSKFLSLLGALLCGPLALTFPTYCHLKIVAKTNQ